LFRIFLRCDADEYHFLGSAMFDGKGTFINSGGILQARTDACHWLRALAGRLRPEDAIREWP
jgi:hypothetical protein